MKTIRPFMRFAVALAALAISPTSARADLLEISDMFVFGDSLSDGGNSGELTAGVHAATRRTSSRRLRMPAGASPTAPPPSSSSGTCYNTDGGLRPSLRRAARISPSAVRRPAWRVSTRSTPTCRRTCARHMRTTVPPGSSSGSRPTRPRTASIRRRRCSSCGCSRTTCSMRARRHAAGRRPWLAGRRQRDRERHRQHPDDDPDSRSRRRAALPGSESRQSRQHARLRGYSAAPRLECRQHRVQYQPRRPARDARCGAAPPRSPCSTRTRHFSRCSRTRRLSGSPTPRGQCVENLQNGLCNPDEWLFWDGVHPTTRTHEILARQFRLASDSGTGDARATGSGPASPWAFIRRR